MGLEQLTTVYQRLLMAETAGSLPHSFAVIRASGVSTSDLTQRKATAPQKRML
jgi:hypothetical protein